MVRTCPQNARRKTTETDFAMETGRKKARDVYKRQPLYWDYTVLTISGDTIVYVVIKK